MSDAAVRFETLDFDDAPPGAEQRFGFACPKQAGRRCDGLIIAGRTSIKRDPQGQNGGLAQWGWDGNREAPTFNPSIDCKGCWHGYIRNGRCVNTSGNEEPEPKA
jgi:hypothetical protein